MRPKTDGTGVFAAAALVVAFLASGLGGVAAAQGEGPISGGRNRYKLPPSALAGLPTGIVVERLAKRLPTGTAPPGIQYFQSPSGLTGVFVHRGAALDGNRLIFPVAGEWTFLGGHRFQQLGPGGNRLIIEDDKLQVFNAAGRQIGALQGPEVGQLSQALMRVVM